MMPKFSISVRKTQPETLYDYEWVEYSVKEIGRRSHLECWLICWVRMNYWVMTATNDSTNFHTVDILQSIDIMPPKWVCKLFKWNTNI